jgi:hypothetical protein
VAGGREDEEVEEDSGGWSTTGLRVEDLRSANEDDEAAGASEGRGGGERRWAPHDIRRIADERRCDIDRRSNLTVGEFLEQYVKRNKPVMITGGSLFRDWPAVGGADGGGSGGGARKGGNTGGTWRREAFIRKYGKSTLATVRSSDSIAPYRGIGGETAANGEGAVGAVGAAGAAGGGTTKFMTVEEYINTPEQGWKSKQTSSGGYAGSTTYMWPGAAAGGAGGGSGGAMGSTDGVGGQGGGPPTRSVRSTPPRDREGSVSSKSGSIGSDSDSDSGSGSRRDSGGTGRQHHQQQKEQQQPSSSNKAYSFGGIDVFAAGLAEDFIVPDLVWKSFRWYARKWKTNARDTATAAAVSSSPAATRSERALLEQQAAARRRTLFYLGRAGTGAQMHSHTPALNLLAFGRKKWFLAVS